MRLILLPLTVCLCFVMPGLALAVMLSESASYSFNDSTSDKEGCDVALTRVKKKILEQVCGTRFAGGSGRFRAEGVDELSLFLFESVGGQVMDTHVLGKEVATVTRNSVSGDYVKQCTVSAFVDVRCDQGRRDPGFAPSFATDVLVNETVFRENDSMQITMTAASEMYVSVFQYMPAESEAENVQLIFPNQMQRESVVKKGQILRIPDNDTARGYRLAMRLPPGKDRLVEELMLVATKKVVTFPGRMTLSEFHRILAEIPLDDRRDAIFPYLIVKKGATPRIKANGPSEWPK